MKKQLIQINEKYQLFQRGDSIVIGVSGGADSVCLLHLLAECAKDWDLSLYVLHVHHGIRGEEADRDAMFVEILAKQFRIPFRLIKEDVPALAKRQGLTEEEAGRKLRYEVFEKYRKEVNADSIAVAHHQKDQAETVLFQLFRGSGLRGLCGIPVKRGKIIRPLLYIRREEIETYLAANHLSYQEDKTNQEDIYARNKIRNQILPLSEEINQQSVAHIARAAERLSELQKFVEGLGREAFKKVATEEADDVMVDIELFMREPEVLQDEILRYVFEKMIVGAKDVAQVHYEQIKFLVSGENGKKIDLPGGLEVQREYKYLRFHTSSSKEEQLSLCFACVPPCSHIVKSDEKWYKISIEVKDRVDLPETIPQKDYTKWLDYDMIKSNLVIRNPKLGDYFILDKFGRKKKLSRFFVDQKIPRERRKEQVLLAEENHVLWNMQGRISESCKISDKTKKVLVITKERIRHERGN